MKKAAYLGVIHRPSIARREQEYATMSQPTANPFVPPTTSTSGAGSFKSLIFMGNIRHG
jgi:hypothetical protein